MRTRAASSSRRTRFELDADLEGLFDVLGPGEQRLELGDDLLEHEDPRLEVDVLAGDVLGQQGAIEDDAELA